MTQGEYILPDDISVGENPGSSSPRIDLNRRFRDLKREVVESFEREYTREVLQAHGGNLAAASRQAGMDRKNLWALAKKYNIDLDSLRTNDD
jgi:DNA-binding NtrC family response regulator